MFKTDDEKTENDLGLMMEHNTYGEPSRTATHSQVGAFTGTREQGNHQTGFLYFRF